MTQQYPTPGYDATRSYYLPSTSPLSQPTETRWAISVSIEPGLDPLVASETVFCFSKDEGIVGYDIDTGQPQCSLAEAGIRSAGVESTTMYFISGGDVGAISLQTGTELWRASREFMSIGRKSLVVTDDALYAVGQRKDTISEEYRPMVVKYDQKSGGGVEYRIWKELDARMEGIFPTNLATYREEIFILMNYQFELDDDSGEVPPTAQHTALVKWDGGREWVFDIKNATEQIAVGPDNVYVAGSDGGTHTPVKVVAVDRATGVQSWETQLPADASGLVRSDDTLYVTLSEAGILALDTHTGQTKWENYDYDTTSKSVVVDDTLYVGRQKQHGPVLSAMETHDGTERWSHDLNMTPIRPPVVLADGVVLSGSDKTVWLDAATVDETESAATHGDEAHSCSECGEPVAADANFCANCGVELASQPSCPSCGSTLSGGESFCPECGQDLSSDPDTCPVCDAALTGDESFCAECGSSV